jgi:RNA polymerase sigma-70 factor (ECF subfamily)
MRHLEGPIGGGVTIPAAGKRQAASDDALMRRAQADERQALGLLYERHFARALRVARSVSHDPACAEDAVQDGFLSIWRVRASYRPGAGGFQAWAMRIVHNRAIDLNRRNAAKNCLLVSDYDYDREPFAISSPYEEMIARSEGQALRGALRQLPGPQAQAIVLAYFCELTHTEIAEQLGLPVGTVKGRIRLGLKKLRTQPQAQGPARWS